MITAATTAQMKKAITLTSSAFFFILRFAGRPGMGTNQPLACIALRLQTDRQNDEQHHEPDHGIEDDSRGNTHQACSQLDQRAGEILWVQEQYGFAVGPGFWVSVAKDTCPCRDQLIAGGEDVIDLVADVVNAARWVFGKEPGDWGRRRPMAPAARSWCSAE